MTAVGSLLRHWRQTRRMSQLEVAEQAEISARHLSFVETGRSRPSRQVILVLASVLEVPLRERNVLLHSAGFAPAYRESGLDDPELAPVRRALDHLLAAHEPFPAVVVDPCWNVLLANAAQCRLSVWLTGRLPQPGTNLLKALFDPRGLRPFIANFEEAAAAMMPRLYRDALSDARVADLLEEILALPGVPEDLRRPRLDTPSLLVPTVLRKGEVEVALFSTITTLGTAGDVTAEEVRIETMFPADDPSERLLRALSAEPLPA